MIHLAQVTSSTFHNKDLADSQTCGDNCLFTELEHSLAEIFNTRANAAIFNLNVQDFWFQPLLVILAVRNSPVCCWLTGIGFWLINQIFCTFTGNELNKTRLSTL